jgi:acid phosphatase class B
MSKLIALLMALFVAPFAYLLLSAAPTTTTPNNVATTPTITTLITPTLTPTTTTPTPTTTLTHIPHPHDHHVIGFDIDDTVVFSSPAFTHAKGTKGGSFWSRVNTSDHLSHPLTHTIALVREHQRLGHTIYLITARKHTPNETLSATMATLLGIPSSHTYFRDKGKTSLIKELGITTFYGDSDTDITDAQAAGATGVRVPRHPSSSYTNKDGTMRKYHPGTYGELVLPFTPSY